MPYSCFQNPIVFQEIASLRKVNQVQVGKSTAPKAVPNSSQIQNFHLMILVPQSTFGDYKLRLLQFFSKLSHLIRATKEGECVQRCHSFPTQNFEILAHAPESTH